MKILLVLLALAGCAPVFAQDYNYTGYGDTLPLTLFKADSLRYTTKLELSAFEDLRVVVKARDVAVAGFATDSIAFYWGYQTWTLVMDSSRTSVGANKIDTAFDLPITVDTFTVDSFCNFRTKLGTGTLLGNSLMTRTIKGYADTVSVTGFACQSLAISTEWDRGIRFWAKGLAKNRIGSVVQVQFDVKRRKHKIVHTD